MSSYSGVRESLFGRPFKLVLGWQYIMSIEESKTMLQIFQNE